MEVNTAKMNRALKACKNYLGEAKNEINNLESDIASEMESYRMKVAAISSGIGATLLIGGGTCTLMIFWAIYKNSQVATLTFEA